MAALKRFGLPAGILELIESIYTDRRFQVSSSDGTSQWKAQSSGISQGCPLSPFLFVMLMTVIMEDAIGLLGPADRRHYEDGSLAVVLYADDTLLIGDSAKSLHRLLQAVATVGGRYGLLLHSDKFQLTQTRTAERVIDHWGNAISVKECMLYLGTHIASSGSVIREVGQRIGAAWSVFKDLQALWKHTQVPRRRKIEVYQAIVTSRLLYGLSSAWINVAELRRLDGFQSRCLRKILGIQPAYYSRVPNRKILEIAQQLPYSRQLLKQQLLLFGKVARAPDSDPLRQLTFCASSLHAATGKYVRRVGRPRNEWALKLRTQAERAAGSSANLEVCLADPAIWSATVSRFIKE